MSEPRLISPLLDGYVMGDPISSHDGVRCCPAMQTDSNRKYIVKVISVPASQVKLDALLLAGAFRDSASALSYFKEIAEGVVEEAVLLQRLSRLDGFLAYDNWQVVPMEDGEVGYDVYLSGSYRPTLERCFRKESMTHLAAVNLGLDICAALAVCRRSGYLYVDLKPGNIFICDDHSYRIGDLGFIRTASLAYASLPEKYLSAYTAPEVTDAYDPLNDTMDIYSAGLILYQAYNGGILPFEGRAPAEPLPPPEYADYEMSQIILKACAPDPGDRWQDPQQMGQALVSYMQRNSVNDTPIIPPAAPVEQEPPEEGTEPITESDPSTEQILAEVDQALDAVGGAADASAAEEAPVEEESPAAEEAPAEEVAEKEPSAPEDAPDETPEPAEDASAEEASGEEPQPELSAEAAAIAEELGVTEEVSQILAQAEDLIAHETPEPVVAPEPIDVPIPEPIREAPEEPEEETPEVSAVSEEEAAAEDLEIPAAAGDNPADAEAENPAPGTGKRKSWIAAVVTLLLLACLSTAGYLFYEHYYLQTILGISLSGEEDRLTVSLNTDTEDELLTVFCTDTYGNTRRQIVSDGKATFSDLTPGTRYTIRVEISGFHRLIGTTTDTYDTAEQTSIVSFTAATGSEDGSVILNFTVQGPETGEWAVTYSAEGEEEKRVSFSGHMVTITGLTLGSRYTFRLAPSAELYMVGTDTVEYTASAIVCAEDLAITGFHGNALTAVWAAPEGIMVESWTVRCYNETGYDKTITVTGTEAVFEDLDVSAAYTVEVNAAGMTVGVRAYVSAGSVTVNSITVDDSDRNRLHIRWDFEGTAPDGGWLLLYSLDGSAEQQVIQCADNSGVIDPMVPGSHYAIVIKPADGSTVFGGTAEYSAPAAEVFSGYLLTAADMSFRMCRTPANPEWGQYDVPSQDYTTTFAPGESASFAVRLNHEYNTSSDEIVTLFIIRDAEGRIVSTATQSRSWTSMWYRGFGRINLPALPESPGSYTVEICFNGATVTNQPFTIA